MDKDEFLLKDKIKEIEKSFIDSGWVTICKNDSYQTIFCCLVDSEKINSYRRSIDWVINPTEEGKASVILSYTNGKAIYKYHSQSNEGIEPFIFVKDFSFSDGSCKSYTDISEEFVLYYKLYEKGTDKQNRKFYFIDEVGDLDEVIDINNNEIRIKLKYLNEYISIRKLYFAICFDFRKLIQFDLDSNNVNRINETFNTDSYYYQHVIRDKFTHTGYAESWVRGKVILAFDKNKSNSYHLDKEKKYEEFIVGYDNDGNYEYKSCSKSTDKIFFLTYFKKEVLNKYYNQPNKYKVDSFHISSSFFSLKIDNNIENYVAVFLTDLGSLPNKEQLHWKQYNIAPQNGISSVYHKTMIEGNWSEHPITPDLFFKHKYAQFNKNWEKKFGWKLYKPLAKENEHYYKALHIPTTNNIKSFCEQILALVIVTIDSLNEKEISKFIQKDDSIKSMFRN